MKRLITVALIGATALADEVAVEWAYNTDPVNGYIVRYGPSTNNLIASQYVGNTNSAVIVNVPPQIQVFVAVQAVGLDGRLSDLSNIIGVQAAPKPQAPVGLKSRITVTTFEITVTNIVNIITNTVVL